jgi:hypothetical protein
MIEHVYTLLCAKTAADSETSQLSLIDLIEELDITPLP